MAEKLSKFEGKDVVSVGVEMPGAAGGLREAMKFDPVEWHQGDEGHIVLHFTVEKVRFEPIVNGEPTGPQRRVHVLQVDQAAPIESAVVERHLKEHAQRIRKARDEAEGKQAIPGIDGEGDGSDNVIDMAGLEQAVDAKEKRGRKKATARKSTARKPRTK